MGQRLGKDISRAQKQLKKKGVGHSPRHATQAKLYDKLMAERPELLGNARRGQEKHDALLSNMQRMGITEGSLETSRKSVETTDKATALTADMDKYKGIKSVTEKIAQRKNKPVGVRKFANYVDIVGPDRGVPKGQLPLSALLQLVMDFQRNPKESTPSKLSKQYGLPPNSVVDLVKHYRHFMSLDHEFIRGNPSERNKRIAMKDVAQSREALSSTQTRHVDGRPATIEERISSAFDTNVEEIEKRKP